MNQAPVNPQDADLHFRSSCTRMPSHGKGREVAGSGMAITSKRKIQDCDPTSPMLMELCTQVKMHTA